MSISPDLTYRLMVQGVSDYAIYMVDRDGLVLNWNAGAERLQGWRPEDIIGRSHAAFYSGEEQAAGVPRWNLDRALREGRARMESWRYRQDGTAFWAGTTTDAIHDGTGAFVGFVKITCDLTAQREHLARIEHNANHDALTGLLNRGGLFRRLGREVSRGASLAVYCIDLDRFKPVNDRFGHPAGDAVLREVGCRLRTVFDATGFAGRIGGDEFVAVKRAAHDPAAVLALGDRMMELIRRPIEIGVDGRTVRIGASVGVVIARPSYGADLDAMLRDADTALYKAKRNGRNRVRLFEAP